MKSIIILLLRFLAVGSAFFITILLTKYYGKNIVGDYARVTSFVGIASSFGQFGLPLIAIRRYQLCKIEGGSSRKNMVSSFMIFTIISSFIASIFCWVALGLGVSYLLTLKWFILIFGLTALQSQTVLIAEIFRAAGHVFWASIVGNYLNIILMMLIFLLGLVFDSINIDKLVIVNVVVQLLAVFLFGVLLLNFEKYSFYRGDLFDGLSYFLKTNVLHDSTRTVLIIGFSGLMMQVPIVAVTLFGGTSSEVADISVAMRILGVVWILSSIVQQIYAKEIAEVAVKNNLEEIRRAWRTSTLHNILFVSVPSLLIFLYADFVIEHTVGNAFKSGSQYLEILALTYAINGFSGQRGLFIINLGRQNNLWQASMLFSIIILCYSAIFGYIFGIQFCLIFYSVGYLFSGLYESRIIKDIIV